MTFIIHSFMLEILFSSICSILLPFIHSFLFEILFHPFCSLLLPFIHSCFLQRKNYSFITFIIHSFMLEILFHPFCSLLFIHSFILALFKETRGKKTRRKER
jgi:hypothetical protein